MVNKYRPSNGTDGECFMEKWCYQCALCNIGDEDKEPCAILGNALFHSIDDKNYPEEWQYNAVGEPVCTKFTTLTAEDGYKCPDTIDLFTEVKDD